jgi:hypothetical protein
VPTCTLPDVIITLRVAHSAENCHTVLHWNQCGQTRLSHRDHGCWRRHTRRTPPCHGVIAVFRLAPDECRKLDTSGQDRINALIKRDNHLNEIGRKGSCECERRWLQDFRKTGDRPLHYPE